MTNIMKMPTISVNASMGDIKGITGVSGVGCGWWASGRHGCSERIKARSSCTGHAGTECGERPVTLDTELKQPLLAQQLRARLRRRELC
jgi:hypothetical protein